MPAGSTLVSEKIRSRGSKAYLLRLPFGVSITTTRSFRSCASNDDRAVGAINPCERCLRLGTYAPRVSRASIFRYLKPRSLFLSVRLFSQPTEQASVGA